MTFDETLILIAAFRIIEIILSEVFKLLLEGTHHD